ncbi:hypothetical protein Tco_0401169 [Tanacetum coccineum]
MSFVSQQATASQVIDDVMRQLSFEEIELDGEAGFADFAGSGVESSGLSHDKSFGFDDLDLNLNERVRTQEFTMEDVVLEDYMSSREDVEQGNGQEDESAPSTADDDDADEDEDFLVDEENEIVVPDVDVHLFGISMDLPFDNIGVTNIVLDDVLEGEDVDVINADGFDNDPRNDDETNDYRRSRLGELMREMEDFINDSDQGTGPTGPNHGMEAGPNGSSGLTTKSKKGRIQIFDQVRVNPDIPVKTVQDQLQRDLEIQISMSKTFRAKAEREIRGDNVL